MEQHPIPRNITGFQFHLIGDMTVRQFGYLGGGALIGFLIYKSAPVSSAVSIILALLVFAAGFAFAFLPIQERSLDRWVLDFIRSILSPTQYLWHKENTIPDILLRPASTHTVKTPIARTQAQAHSDSQVKLKNYLSSLPKQPDHNLNLREKQYVDKTLSLFNVGGKAHVVADQHHPTRSVSAVNADISLKTGNQKSSHPLTDKKEEKKALTVPTAATKTVPPVPSPDLTGLKNAFAEEKKTPSFIKPKSTPPPAKAVVKPPKETHTPALQVQKPPGTEKEGLELQYEQLRKEKKKLEEQLNRLQSAQKPTPQESKIIKPAQSKEKEEPTIKIITPSRATDEIGLPKTSQSPNIVIGVVKDTDKKILPNILITIKDTNSMPVRALKTNKLGQFAAATPLSNGIYHLELEDPLKRYTFDIAEINLEGKDFLPIEIIAKGEKEAIREKLSQELFGNITPS